MRFHTKGLVFVLEHILLQAFLSFCQFFALMTYLEDKAKQAQEEAAVKEFDTPPREGQEHAERRAKYVAEALAVDDSALTDLEVLTKAQAKKVLVIAGGGVDESLKGLVPSVFLVELLKSPEYMQEYGEIPGYLTLINEKGPVNHCAFLDLHHADCAFRR